MSLTPPPDQLARKKVQKSEALWMMSFSDMCLVLLCFFVLMIATMKPDKEKFNHVKEGMVAETHLKKTDSMKQVSSQLKKIIQEKKLSQKAQVTYDADGLQIELKNQLVFQSGSAALNRNFDTAAREVMRLVAKLGQRYHLKVEGHTDDAPSGRRGRGDQNWELSAARGFSMMRKLQQFGVAADRLSVVAYAHTRPKVSVKGLRGKQLANARAKNRRVVIRIE